MMMSSPDDFFANVSRLGGYLRVTALAAVLVLPIVLRDLLRLSHRWVGPILRLRAALSALSRGEHVPPLRFREGDYWQELAGDFNTIAADLNRLRAASGCDTELAPAAADEGL
jgi:nitrate/nitrite-specific signal transduction histidine kinase